MRNYIWIGLPVLLAIGPVPAGRAAETGPLLAKIKAVGREGAGNAAAAQAWKELVRLGPAALLEILAGLDDANPVAANWLRSAVDAIAEREVQAGRALPAAQLEAFTRDRRHAGPPRRLAYELLVKADSTAPRRLLPTMLDDPSAELRRDAVARVLDEAQKRLDQGDKPAATAAYRKAFAAALDRDQVDLGARRLKGLGVAVDLTAHFGFIPHWHLVGPFDNTDKTGFAKVFPPEQGVNLAARYPGKQGAELRWIAHTTTDPYGMVDLNKALGKNMGVTAYGYTVVTSPREQTVQIRTGSNNAVKVFLNGKLIAFRDEYHHGLHMDQHVGKGTLKAGRNEILIKVCQNEQKDSWAQLWSFQLRVCDPIGTPVPLTVVADPARNLQEGKVRP